MYAQLSSSEADIQRRIADQDAREEAAAVRVAAIQIRDTAHAEQVHGLVCVAADIGTLLHNMQTDTGVFGSPGRQALEDLADDLRLKAEPEIGRVLDDHLASDACARMHAVATTVVEALRAFRAERIAAGEPRLGNVIKRACAALLDAIVLSDSPLNRSLPTQLRLDTANGQRASDLLAAVVRHYNSPGWPRPYADRTSLGETSRLPVPWIVGSQVLHGAWAAFRDDQTDEALEKGLCTVCGDRIEPVIFYGVLQDLGENGRRTSGPGCCPRCMLVSLQHCPYLAGVAARGSTQVVAWAWNGEGTGIVEIEDSVGERNPLIDQDSLPMTADDVRRFVRTGELPDSPLAAPVPMPQAA